MTFNLCLSRAAISNNLFADQEARVHQKTSTKIFCKKTTKGHLESQKKIIHLSLSLEAFRDILEQNAVVLEDVRFHDAFSKKAVKNLLLDSLVSG